MPKTRASWGSNQPAARKGYRTLRYWADEHDGRGYMRHTKTIKGSKRDGDAELARLRLRHDDDRPCPTIQQAWDTWVWPEYEIMHAAYLDDPRPSKRGTRESIKTSTLAQVKSTWRRHVQPRWGATVASGIRYSDVQEWLDTKTEQVANRCLQQLSLILRYCLINDCIDKNVCSPDYKYRMPTKANRYDHGVLALEDLDGAVAPAVRGRVCEPAVLLSAFAGCRPGEALAPLLDEVEEIEYEGLRWAAVTISRQVNDDGVVSDDGDLKNKWSVRVAVVPPPWSERILEIRDEREGAGLEWLSDNGLCEPIRQRNMRKDYYRCMEAAGQPRLQFRSLRRSWRTWMSSKGISREILERMMGHSDGSTTGRFYLEADARTIIEEMARACDWGSLASELRGNREK